MHLGPHLPDLGRASPGRTIQRWETGARMPNAAAIDAIAVITRSKVRYEDHRAVRRAYLAARLQSKEALQ